MTTDPLFPDTPDAHPDDVDLLASRLVDGDITAENIPSAVRVEVERRALEFSKLRSRLLGLDSSIESSARREAQIALALRSTANLRGTRLIHRRSSRVALAVAASIIGVLVVSTFVMQRDDPSDVDVFANSIADVSAEQGDLSQTAPVLESSGGSSKSSIPETDPPALTMDAIDDAPPPLPEYSSVDDIARVAASLPPGGSVIEGLNQRVEIPRCAVGPTPPLRTEGAILEDVRVEIHFRERGEFVVYDISDCSTVASRPALP
jgi:hypothetical protein